MKKRIRILMPILAIILTSSGANADRKSDVIFKLIKPITLVGSERLDLRVTFQNGRRIKTSVDETKPFCQVFFNSEAVSSHHGKVGPLTLTTDGMDGVRVNPGVANTSGFVSVQVSASKAQAFPEKDSFSVSCSVYSEDARKVSLFTFDQISKILGTSFKVTVPENSHRDVAQDIK